MDIVKYVCHILKKDKVPIHVLVLLEVRYYIIRNPLLWIFVLQYETLLSISSDDRNLVIEAEIVKERRLVAIVHRYTLYPLAQEVRDPSV